MSPATGPILFVLMTLVLCLPDPLYLVPFAGMLVIAALLIWRGVRRFIIKEDVL